MKKEGFNPRINSDSTKNLFKMDLDDIDEQNKLLESKLKSKKTKINHIDYSIKKIDSTKISSRDKNHLQNSCNYEVSFVSNKSTISPRESKCSSKPRSPQMMTRFKNKLDTSILNTSNLEIKTSKTTKNLIPFTEEERKMKDLVNKMKICQKHNLPNEKNYFVTEKNLKLIENALSEKDTDISNLKNLVYYAKNEFDNFKLKFKELNRVIEEQAEEKAEILKAYDNMAKYNKQLKENYDDYSFQYNKMLIYFKKLESLVHLVVKLKDSYHDTEKSETIVTKIEKLESKSNKYVKKKPNMKASEETLIYIPKTKKNDPDLSKVIENIKQISQILEEDELKAYVALFISSEVKNSLDNKNFLKSSSVIDYQKLEKENKQLKDKVYDYESFVEKMSFLYESKKFDLTDMAKDMIDTKKRISQITSMNDSLEKENDYLRISYHNLYVNFI
jgi:hypothetical protein